MPSNLTPTETIKSCLCPESCSKTTLDLLNDFLFAVSASTAPISKSRTSRIATSKKRNTPDNATTQIHTIAERQKLAIEVINICLGSLASATPAPSNETSTNDVTKTRLKSTSAESKALQARSGNRNDRLASLDSVDYLATCCSVSISYIQSIQIMENGVQNLSTQTENARLSLSQKLIQVGKFKFALKELKALKRKLEAIMQNKSSVGNWVTEEDAKIVAQKPNKMSTTKKLTSGKENTEKDANETENLSKILEFTHINPTSPAFPFVIACQLGILKCVVGLKQHEAMEAMLPSFMSPSSPLTLLKTFSRVSPSKALIYTSQLIYTLNSMAPATTLEADCIAIDPSKSCSPRASIIVQLNLLEAMGFQRTLRQESENKPWNPSEKFGIYLAAFIRRSSGNCDPKRKRQSYILVRDLITRLRNINGCPHNLTLNVLERLSSMSSDARVSEECIQWTKQWLEQLTTIDDPNNQSLIVVCKVRIAAIQMHLYSLEKSDGIVADTTKISALEENAKSAACGLEKLSRGRQRDLELLLREAGQLRRSTLEIMAALFSANQSSENGNQIEARRRLRKLCDDSLRAVISYCKRYKSMKMTDEQLSLVFPVLKPTIDAVLSTCWRDFEIDRAGSWEEFESILMHAWSASDKVEEMQDLYVKFSAAYYRIFLLYRNNTGFDPEAVRALRNSISVMDNRPADELVEASILRRLEHLGSIFLSARDYNKATEPFLNAIKCASTIGLLEGLGHRATNGESVQQIMTTDDADVAAIGRVLAGLIRIAMRKKDGVADELRFDQNLSISTQGIIQEWVFKLTLDKINDEGILIRIVAERLLDMYSFEEMPLRKSRVIANLLALEVDQPGLLNQDEVINLGEDVSDWAFGTTPLLEEDEHLKHHRNDILARTYMGLAFCYWQRDGPRQDLIRKALSLWTNMMSDGNWDNILKQLDDFKTLVRMFEMMIEFFDMKHETELKIEVLGVLLRFRDLEKPRNYDALVDVYSSLGLEFHRLGYSGKAGVALGKAQAYLKMPDVEISTPTRLKWHLAYTEYLIGINNLTKSLESFQAAGELVEQDDKFAADKRARGTIAWKIKVNRIISDAAYVSGLLAFERGDTNEALHHARRCIRLNNRTKATLETLQKPNLDQLASGIDALKLTQQGPKVYSSTERGLNMPSVWPVVSSIYLANVLSAEIYRHLGMVMEALYFAKRALDIAKAVDAKPAIAQALILVADMEIRSGKIEEGELTLEDARGMIGDGRLTYAYEVCLGNLKRLQGDFDEELKAYERARHAIDNLLDTKNIQRFGNPGCTDETGIADQLAGLEIKQSEKRPARPKTPTRSRATKPAKTIKSAPVPKKAMSIVAECSLLQKQKGIVGRLVAYNLALQGQCTAAMEALEDASKLPAGPHEEISQGLVEARNLLQQALDLVSADPIFNCLQDSTISLPSIAMYGDIANPTEDAPAPAKKPTRKVTVKKAKAFIEVLQKARDCAYAVHKRAVTIGSSSTVHRAASLLAGIIVLLSAMTNSKGHGPEHPLYASYSLELQKGIFTHRQKLVVDMEKAFASVPEEYKWPRLELAHAKSHVTDPESFEFKSFQSHFVDIIPKQWAVVSVSLSENRDELYVSRFQAGRSQLMVRLPLTRHNSRDDYQDLFDYNDGLQEFKEIITLTTENTHAAKGILPGKDRQAWWAEREALDSRLSDLLANMEHVWLGGFKGIFCQYAKNPTLFGRFKTSFDKILAKHVPSRKKKKNGRIDIDNRILEFFIALGDPEKDDLDEALVDLIYFVIDILQFHGEGNAYDEVDVDSMVVEMKGALGAYHDEALWRPQDMEAETDHTILILEKSVQMFPWESMPCLRGHSVSRLPSLAALRARILGMNSLDKDETKPGYYADGTSGGYILNPSSDLEKTQKIFEAELKHLNDSWTSVVNRAPTEKEFSGILETKDIFLYFGHGSGSHYLPAKNVRQLDRCAVACLMGCSSGVLQDNGEFEPWGVTANYLVAGSPAVLATLWDVTDRDIDSFAKDAFAKWGVLSPPSPAEENPKKGKGRAKKTETAAEPQSARGQSLVQAVATAREQCKLKYLNGAAPVVYGIPVYISR
ncbi:peptidase family C50-domain-containing protein [Geopyxis carbonaria]|nr:peptidase family C50-domain-containing protein [Geopyxis carbonaria]